jgi:cell wall-associated NlpC family hydrolase
MMQRITRQQIVTEARSWIGTPYEHLGRAKGAGVDCSQHIIAVAVALGYVAPDFNIPAHAPRPHPRIFAELTKHLDQIPVEDARPGDILIFCFSLKTRTPQHMGFVTDFGLCHVHPHSDIARVVEHRLDDYFRERIVSAWRFRGVELQWSHAQPNVETPRR